MKIENSTKMGEIFRKEMKAIKSEMIEIVRGKGLLNAVAIKPTNGKSAWDICLALKELIPLAQLENNQTLKLQHWATSGRIRLASSKNIYIN
mgnify:CR=1 FL=1